MNLVGPEIYTLDVPEQTAGSTYVLRCSNGSNKFSGLCSRLNTTKIYIVSFENRVVYVGVTGQRMSTRLRLGFTATGQSGYHGYKWRRSPAAFKLHVWALNDFEDDDAKRHVETIEAEVVFRVRLSGQWPEFQTEIHFHPSDPRHRALADQICQHFESLHAAIAAHPECLLSGRTVAPPSPRD